ncbi:hypothetical protein HQ312_11395 [Rhodococcus sp. BP-316]|uniref:hypothetical protein n=1 Tax=Rhodococcus sp. BP-316 TaxID=2739445 RepID=UPI001C9ACB36|nr:hypothetical protein [Rhodococcus sp. BP-316]MBY6681653.1 hypothetical protein [Rhodococcus sp. BP-316]
MRDLLDSDSPPKEVSPVEIYTTAALLQQKSAVFSTGMNKAGAGAGAVAEAIALRTTGFGVAPLPRRHRERWAHRASVGTGVDRDITR